ncbi:MAG: caspase family protein [Deltaproteobacteria bacterium]|nr:caspase family protein [Deltaproteobacteria bacterium]
MGGGRLDVGSRRILQITMGGVALLVCMALSAPAFAGDCDDAAKVVASGNKMLDTDALAGLGYYSTALKLCPDSSEARFNSGLAYLKTGNLDRAADEFQRAIKLKPGHRKAYANLAWILVEKERDIGKGVELARERLTMDEDPRLMAIMGLGLAKQGRSGEAVKWLLKASAADPANKDRYETLVQRVVAGVTVPETYAAQRTADGAGEKLPPLRPETHAVVIGIDYKDRPDVPGLRYASSDARKVYDVFTDPRYGGVPKENAILLLNEKANRNAIKAALRRIRNETGYVYVYYSGHGAPKMKEERLVDAYLIPYDADISSPEAIEDSAIKVSDVQSIIDASKAKAVMVALDACFTGGGKSVTARGAKPLVGVLASADLIKPRGAGRVVLTSSASNQQSWEDDVELKSGIFSFYLIEGMKGKAGSDAWVKTNDLAEYVKTNVASAALRLKGEEQTPQSTGAGDFDVTRNWPMAKVMDADTAKARLKSAFERELISEDQLSRSLDELKGKDRSRTLKSFLEGKIDEKRFGELY